MMFPHHSPEKSPLLCFDTNIQKWMRGLLCQFFPINKSFKSMKKKLPSYQILRKIMKISLLQIALAVLCMSFSFAHDTKAQDLLNKKVTIHLKKNEVEDVLHKIEKQVGINFMYSPELIESKRKVSIDVDAKPLSEVLSNFLSPLNIHYEVSGQQILLKRKNETPTENNQSIIPKLEIIEQVITGMVKDEKGEALVGVSIQIKGTARGTTTDPNGKFRLSIPNEEVVLVFTSVGYIRSEVIVGKQTSLNVVLRTDVGNLDEIVVVGYGTQKKRDITGSVASVNTKDLKSLPVANIGEAMQGRAAGVQVVSSGSPGSNVTLRVRGTGTINNSDPLLVIDGVPTDIPLNTLNQDNIASIEVLKDASASAIYGARGANGVVLITTKQGLEGKSNLEFRMFTSQQAATNIVKMLDATQFASLHNEMMANNGQAQNPAYSDPVTLGKGTDWLGVLFNTAPMTNYSLAYSGGTAQSKFYVSGAMLNQEGIVLKTNFKRYNVQFNSDSKVFSWLKFGNNLTLSHDIKSSGDYNIRNTMAALPTQSIYNNDGSYSGPVGRASWYGDLTNPIGKANLTENSTLGYNVLGNIYAELAITKALKFKTTGGVQASFWNNRTWSPKYNWQPIPQPNSFLFQQSNKSITWLWDNYLTYTNTFNDIHSLTLLVGSSAQNNRYDYMSGSIQNFANDNTQQLNNGSSSITLNGSASEWALLSFIGRVNYAFKDKYLLTATIRRDGSSRFGENNRWGVFPSGSLAWRISEEDFMKQIHWISDTKIRVGYGITGNQNIGNYSFASVLQTVQYNFNGNAVGAVVPQAIPNPSVRWEQVEQSNLGFDATLLGGAINLTIDAYLKNTNNMLVPMSVPISTGYSDIYVPSINAGKVQNKGIEVNITSHNLKGNIEWNTSFNVSYNQNKVVSLNDSVPLYTGSIGLNQNLSIQKNGLPVNAFYGFVTNGIFQTQEEVEKYAIQVPGNDPFNRTSAGDVKFRDLNNDGKIDDNDRTYIGNPNPRFIFGLNNSFSWKGIDLAIFIQGVEGNKIFNANRIYQEGMSVAQNQTTAVLNRWRGEGTSNTIPRAIFNDPNKNARVSDRFIEDGSYLRLKNITVGYNFPKQLIEKLKLQSARLYVSAQNIYTLTNYKGFDPEVSVNGIDLNVYPVTRTFSAGVNLIF